MFSSTVFRLSNRSRVAPVAALACALSLSLASGSVAQISASEGAESAGSCWGQPLSPAAMAVNAALPSGGLSRLGTCNQLTSSILPEDDWLHVIETPADFDAYRTAIRDLLVDTRSTFSLSRLASEKVLLSRLSSGLCELHRDLSTSERPDKPVVRLHFSNPLGDAEAHTRAAWEALVNPQDARRCLPLDPAQWNFHLAVRTAASVVINNKWNHSKLTVRDEVQAITGSVETSNPELAIELTGDAAGKAQTFYEAVWATEHRDQFCLTTEESICRPRKEWKVSVPPAGTLPTILGTNVFSLGRNFPLWYGGDDSADHAVYAAFEAAEETLFISQPDFIYLSSSIVEELVDRVAEAAGSGADVRIALGSEGPWSTQDQAQQIFDRASWLLTGLTPDWVDYYMSLCRIRIADHPNHPSDSHAKSFEVDRTLFYVGSQNLYPSGIGNDGPAELSEHGFLVDGYQYSKPLAARYHSEYAAPTWTNAVAGDGMWMTGEADCGEVIYPTRLQGTASNGYSCDITFDTAFDFQKLDLDEVADFYGEGVCVTNGYTIDITVSGEIDVTGDPLTYGQIQNGVISGSLRGFPVSDTAPLTGTLTVDGSYANQLDASFDGLELGVTYSGTVTRE